MSCSFLEGWLCDNVNLSRVQPAERRLPCKISTKRFRVLV